MTIHYPNGQPKRPEPSSRSQNINYGKRGQTLENDLAQSNEVYRLKNRANIHKKPTPIQVVRVDYPKRSAAKITEAYYRRASTTDYNGIYRGYYIDFEAKETKNTTRFPLKNFHDHQIEHLRQCQEMGGICFAILSFSEIKRIFIIDALQLCYYWDNQRENGYAKSISLQTLEDCAIELDYGFSPPIPYLDAVDQLIGESEHRKKEQ